MKKSILLFLIIIMYNLSCTYSKGKNNLPSSEIPISYNIIPKPKQLKKTGHLFRITKKTKILINSDQKELAKYLNHQLGYELPIEIIDKDIKPQKNTILFSIVDEFSINDEAYSIIVLPSSIDIKSGTEKGLFYAVQTLLQLRQSQNSLIATANIVDEPRYKYRGMHLDVSRHFFSVDFIKKYIDYLAKYKYNSFHWHLTEDQGWRIEIKKYPKLQEIAAYRKETLIGHYSDKPHQYDGKIYGGYYTQEEVKEIVAYAAARHINVIPEIEMPGHAQAAISAYPELGCTGEQIDVATKWGIFEDVYCPNEMTFQFLEDVLTEVMDLFPSKYIHIGGDECPKTAWKESDFCQKLMREKGIEDEHGLQSYFIQRIEKYINSKGRKIIGWDEILEGGLAPNATVMSWRGMKGGIAAAEQGHDVIMTPGTHCYFDHYQSDNPAEPLAIGGFNTVKHVYEFEPTPPVLNAEQSKHILGAQGNVWTEYMKTPEKVEYMIFPRMIALSEVIWSPNKDRKYSEFVTRLEPHLLKLKKEGVNTANHLFNVSPNVIIENGVFVELKSDSQSPIIRYSFDGELSNQSKIAIKRKIPILNSTMLKTNSFINGKPVGRELSIDFILHKAAGKKLSLVNPPSEKYNSGGNTKIINGIMGSNERYGKEWLGFEGVDCIATLDLGKPTDYNQVNMRFYNGKGQWIYPPKSIEILGSNDGSSFQTIHQYKVKDSDELVINADIKFKQQNYRYLKIHVYRHGIIDPKKQGGGHEAWLFVDEIVVN